jgi:hypothetical protein
VIQVLEDQERLLDQPVARPPLDVRDESDAACIVLLAGGVQAVQSGVFEGVGVCHLGSSQDTLARGEEESITLLRRTNPGKENNRGLTPIFGMVCRKA